MTNLLLDTHIWLWLASGSNALPSSTCKLINQAATDNTLFVSAISVWEIAMLEAKGRIQLDQPTLNWVKQALSAGGITLLPLSPEIAIESCQLPNNFHGDPADRILIASAKLENLTLITKDTKLINYGIRKFINVLAID